jgi:hypothetical protein
MSGPSLSSIISKHLESEQIIVTKTETVIKCNPKTLTSCNSSSAHPIAHPRLQRTANKTLGHYKAQAAKQKHSDTLLSYPTALNKETAPKKKSTGNKRTFHGGRREKTQHTQN